MTKTKQKKNLVSLTRHNGFTVIGECFEYKLDYLYEDYSITFKIGKNQFIQELFTWGFENLGYTYNYHEILDLHNLSYYLNMETDHPEYGREEKFTIYRIFEVEKKCSPIHNLL